MKLSYDFWTCDHERRSFSSGNACIMTCDAPFYGTLWLCSSKCHLLLHDTLHMYDNVCLFMDQLLTFTLFSDHFSCPLVTCVLSEHTCSAFQMIALQFIQKTQVSSFLYVMEMTVKVPSWMKLSYDSGLVIMKGKLFHEVIFHDIRKMIWGIIVVTFITAALAVILYFACMQQC